MRYFFCIRTRIRLFFFAHHRTLALLRTLGFEWQAINFLLRRAISFGPIISGQLFAKTSHLLKGLRRHLPEICVLRLQNSPYFCVFKCARAVNKRSGMRLKTESETGERRWKYGLSVLQHRGKTSTHAPGWAFPVSFSVTLSSQIKVSRALSASFCVQLVVQLFCFMLLLKLLLWITRHRSLKQLVD